MTADTLSPILDLFHPVHNFCFILHIFLYNRDWGNALASKLFIKYIRWRHLFTEFIYNIIYWSAGIWHGQLFLIRILVTQDRITPTYLKQGQPTPTFQFLPPVLMVRLQLEVSSLTKMTSQDINITYGSWPHLCWIFFPFQTINEVKSCCTKITPSEIYSTRHKRRNQIMSESEISILYLCCSTNSK